SAPQKQPMPNIACSTPPGNGGCRRWPFTKCVSGTRICSSRPGNASSFDGIRTSFVIALYCIRRYIIDRDFLPRRTGELDMKRFGPALAVAFALVAATRLISGQGHGNPFIDHSDNGEIVHVLPPEASIHSPHDTQPSFAPVLNQTAVYPASYGSGA